MTTAFNTADLASCDADTLAVSTSSSCADGTAPEPNSQARQLKGGRIWDSADGWLRQADGRLHAAALAVCRRLAMLVLHAAPHALATQFEFNPHDHSYVQDDGSAGSVFEKATCQPCASGVACQAGASTPCQAGTFNQILGAASCTACPDGQSSDAGELACGMPCCNGCRRRCFLPTQLGAHHALPSCRSLACRC